MMRQLVLLLGVAFASPLTGHSAALASDLPQPATRVVRIAVTAQTLEGVPISHVVLRALVPRQADGRELMVTNAQGVAEADLTVGADELRVQLNVQQGQTGTLDAATTTAAAGTARAWSFDRSHAVQLNANDTEYAITVTGRPAVSAAFRLTISGQPSKLTVVLRPNPNPDPD